MTKQIQINLIAIMVILILGFASVSLILSNQPEGEIPSGSIGVNRVMDGVTQSTTTVSIAVDNSGTSTASENEIFAVNTSASYRFISNEGGAGLIELFLDDATSSIEWGKGIRLATSSALGRTEYKTDELNPYFGRVLGLSLTATSTPRLVEF